MIYEFQQSACVGILSFLSPCFPCTAVWQKVKTSELQRHSEDLREGLATLFIKLWLVRLRRTRISEVSFSITLYVSARR